MLTSTALVLLSLAVSRCPAAGVLVEQCEPGSPADNASVQPGDILLSYNGQRLLSPATLTALEQNAITTGPVRLVYQRNGQTFRTLVQTGETGIVASISLSDEARVQYTESWASLQSGNTNVALSSAASAARIASRNNGLITAAWVWWSDGYRFLVNHRWSEGRQCFKTAWNLLRTTSDRAAQSMTLSGLGVCNEGLDDLIDAKQVFEQRMQLDQRAGWKQWFAGDLNNLGEIARLQGDLRTSQHQLRASAEIKTRLLSDSLSLAGTLNNLGGVSLMRGDLSAARYYLLKASAITDRRAPGTLDAARIDSNLGYIADEERDLSTAWSRFKDAEQIYMDQAPQSLELAATLGNLGNVELDRGNLNAAEGYGQRAFTMVQHIAPRSPEFATCLNNLGNVYYRKGDHVRARQFHEQARTLRQTLEPGSLDLATSFNNLGVMALQEKRYQDAVSLCSDAAAIVEAQRSEIASPETRGLLLNGRDSEFGGLFQAQLALGDMAGAFTTVERTRARSLSEMLRERDFKLSHPATPRLRTRKRSLEMRRSAAYVRLTHLDPVHDISASTQLYREIEQINAEQRILVDQMREVSPDYAALTYPRALTLSQAQASLQPGTLLLTYVVADSATTIFAITASSVNYYTCNISRDILSQKVGLFLGALSKPYQPYRLQARELFHILIAPALAQIERSNRILICPDGPLEKLPYCALLGPTAPPSRGASVTEFFLIDIKPIHYVASMGVYAELSQTQRTPHTTSLRLLAFGDPAYRTSMAHGHTLRRLPYTKQQVTALGRLYPKRTMVLTGSSATETALFQNGPRARVIHFACHGIIDDKDPFASALVLSPDQPRHDGWLHAYDIMAGLRLKADLVVVSACQSGLGTQTTYEGILGLTRAFQYAGARSQVVSLWEIQDLYSGQLMAELHHRLIAGATKDVALQEAQRAYIRSPNYSHPYFWAAFQLVGDYR